MADAYLALVGSVANVVGNDSLEFMDRLAPYEKARAAAFVRTRDRDSYLAAHWLVRRVAGMVAGLDPRDIELFQHCPGVYRREGEGGPRFVAVPAPSREELERLVQRIAERIGRSLERSGLITRDIENAYLAFDLGEEAPIHGLLGASITYRIATGPREGQKVF